jgi:hypothetical protein
MEVSQEVGTTAQTGVSANDYIVDMWGWQRLGAVVVTLQQVADAPSGSGLKYSIKASVTTADASLAATDRASFYTWIEGYNFARCGLGASGASSLSIGFYVKANRTGTYSGAVVNGTANRSYPFNFTIDVSGTWEYKTVTIPGDTTGTWNTTNGAGMYLYITMAAGSTFVGTADTWAASDLRGVTGTINGIAATSDYMNLTAVSIVQGTVAIPVESVASAQMPFDATLTRCMRYWEKTFNYTTAPAQNAGVEIGEFTFKAIQSGALSNGAYFTFKVRKRANPTFTFYNPSATNAQARDVSIGADCTSTAASNLGEVGAVISTVGNASTGINDRLAIHMTMDARL